MLTCSRRRFSWTSVQQGRWRAASLPSTQFALADAGWRTSRLPAGRCIGSHVCSLGKIAPMLQATEIHQNTCTCPARRHVHRGGQERRVSGLPGFAALLTWKHGRPPVRVPSRAALCLEIASYLEPAAFRCVQCLQEAIPQRYVGRVFRKPQ